MIKSSRVRLALGTFSAQPMPTKAALPLPRLPMGLQLTLAALVGFFHNGRLF